MEKDDVVSLLKQINEKLDFICSHMPKPRERREKIENRAINPKDVLSMYNEVLGEHLGYIQFLTAKRSRAVYRMEKSGVNKLSLWREYFQRVKESPFLLGVNKSSWRATLDWLLFYENYVKVMEGAYKAPVNIPEQYRTAINIIKCVADGQEVNVTPTSSAADVFADIHAVLVQHDMKAHRAYRAVLSIAERMHGFKHTITSKTSLDNKPLASAILYLIKSIV